MKPTKRLRDYIIPEIVKIPIDTNISLALESTPPEDPWGSVIEKHDNDPFKTNIV